MAKDDDGMTEAERRAGLDEENDYAPADPHARHPLDDGDRTGMSDRWRIRRNAKGGIVSLWHEQPHAERLRAWEPPKAGRGH